MLYNSTAIISEQSAQQIPDVLSDNMELQCPVCRRRLPGLEVLVQHIMLAHGKDRMQATEMAVEVWKRRIQD